jgi:hypothetical protein
MPRPPIPRRTTDLGKEKRCVTCGEWWPIDFFHRDRNCFDGHRNECGACRSATRNPRRRELRRLRKEAAE